MNVEIANAIPMPEILTRLGFTPVKQSGSDLWYNSPLNHEKIPNFYVNANKNVWNDFGLCKSGRVIDFVCAYLESQTEDHTVVDALRWLDNMQMQALADLHTRAHTTCKRMSLSVRNISGIKHPSLLNYLSSRGIPVEQARRYLREALVCDNDTGKEFFALAMPNEDGGYELRNQLFKTRIAPKGISFIRGNRPGLAMPEEVHVFKSVYDYLAALTYQQADNFEGDVIILHSLSFLSQALPYIRNYTYRTVYTWLDNDEAGLKAVKTMTAFSKRNSLSLIPMNKIYAPYHDVAAWHIDMLGL